ncbi:hypothetical protein ACFQZC_08530 [Streptacidiphilus monticola]
MLELLGTPVAASGSHVQIAARAQVGPVRVRLWSKVGPGEGATVFDGVLSLEDGAIGAGDILGTAAYVQRIGTPGPHRVLISVDDPGKASRIDVMLDLGEDATDLTAIEGNPLPGVIGSSGSRLGKADELGLILSAHDLPTSRLAAAIKVVWSAPAEVKPDRTEAIMVFRISVIVQWMRWLSPGLSMERCEQLGEFIAENLRGSIPANLDAHCVEIASEAIRRAESR